MEGTITRKDALRAMVLAAAGAAMPLSVFGQEAKSAAELTLDDMKSLEKLVGVSFSDDERKALLEDLKGSQKEFEALRKQPVEQKVAPAIRYGVPVEPKPGRVQVRLRRVSQPEPSLSDADLAFASVAELGRLIRARKVTSERLTRLALDRLKRFGTDPLLCVVTLTEDLALRQARQADAEIARGRYRGPLHGIPYGIKDLFATKGIRTTWGADPYKDQVPEFNATVVEKLEREGAVLVAKLSMGSLALGDVWYAGTTKNPWNLKEGSSGSSAGSASAVAAGLVPFAIGTETQGSIVSPSARCRTCGLRPTFGRVSRFGAMELSYTMDKVGPITRTAEDLALVFAAIAGEDDRDETTYDAAFDYRPLGDLKGMRIGFLPTRIEGDPFVEALRKAGAEVVPHKMTPAPEGAGVVLDVECAAAFDDLTRSGQVNEVKNSPWPRFFRAGRMIPAVEYLRAQRVRRSTTERLLKEMGGFHAIADVGIGLTTIVSSNQAGVPQAIIPFGTDSRGNGRSYSLLAEPFAEARLIAIMDRVQRDTAFHRLRPEGF